jgi:hypothetical protein
MRVTSLEIFDEIITGTGNTWYTPDHLSEVLGNSDVYAIQACVSQVSGSSQQLTIANQTSGDGTNWYSWGTDISSLGTLVNEGTYWGHRDGIASFLLALVRFQIIFGSGTNPSCRLKLYFTGRTYGGSGRAQMAPSVGPPMHRP